MIHVGGGFDVAEILPPRAREYLRRLRQLATHAHRLTPDFADIHEISTAKVQAEARLRQLLDFRSEGGFHLRHEDSRVLDQQTLVAKLSDELQRLRTLDAERSARWTVASQLVAATEAWIRSGRPTATASEDHDGDMPKLIKNEIITDAIERLRRRGRELRSDLSRIRSSPFPSAHVRAKIRREVEALAQIGAPIISDAVEHDRGIVSPMRSLRADVMSKTPTFAATETVDALGLIAFLSSGPLIAALDKLVSEECDDAAALSHVEREKREAETLRDLLAVERDEAALTCAALDQPLPCEHRADINPAALLRVRIISPPRAVSGPSIAFDVVHAAQRP